jgi:oligopeptide transport system ATP-binding protein
MTVAISVRDAKLRFGHTQALDSVTLDVAPRDCFGLVGESGSGKTTLMRVILGLERPQSGSVRLFDEPLKSGSAGIAQRTRLVQAIFQDPAASLSPRRRIGQLLDEVGEVLGEARDSVRARQAALFQRLGLPPGTVDKYPYQLSGGQARRVAVARALLMNPRILIADEPTAGLDVSVQGDLLNLLQELRADRDLTLVVVSHNLAVVRLIADAVAVMHRGRIVEQGPAARVFDKPAANYTKRLLASWPRLRVHA